MKKKVLSVLLSTAMVASLAACGGATETAPSGGSDTQSSDQGATQTADSSSSDSAAAGEYNLTDLYITVDGTLTANIDNGQDAFVEQWEAAVSEKLGHDIKLHINQPEHSGYKDNVSQLLTTGEPGDGQYPECSGWLM